MTVGNLAKSKFILEAGEISFSPATVITALRDEMIRSYEGSGYSLMAHGDEVGLVAAEIARVLFRNSSEVEFLAETARLAGCLHDVGKVTIPEQVRFSPLFFTEIERKIMENHVTAGKRLLESAGFHREIVEAAHFHHVWFAGGGYPFCGLRGEQIPVNARIVSVADHFVARVEDRSYRLGQDPDFVWFEMQLASGTHFDPKVIEAFAQTEYLRAMLA